jgi:hypothetical protein
MKKGIISFLLFGAMVPVGAYAGAWVNKPGESTLINSLYIFHYNQFEDIEGNITDRPDFMKYEYKPYYEYGLRENYSVGFSPSFQKVTGEYTGAFESGIDKNEAFTGVDFFIKRKLFESAENGYAISVMPTLELPGIY